MAGSGVLALPNAMIGTGKVYKLSKKYPQPRTKFSLGWAGLALIILFTVNACFSGTRLGLCWVMLRERYEVFRSGEVRDPYPSIGEKAAGPFARYSKNQPKNKVANHLYLTE